MLRGRGGAGSVCLLSDLGLLPTARRKAEGDRQGQGQEAPTSLKGQEPWLLGELLGGEEE